MPSLLHSSVIPRAWLRPGRCSAFRVIVLARNAVLPLFLLAYKSSQSFARSPVLERGLVPSIRLPLSFRDLRITCPSERVLRTSSTGARKLHVLVEPPALSSNWRISIWGDQQMRGKPQIWHERMRRLCALFLLALFVGPWLLAFAAPDAITEASLPACCRAHGKHKCFMHLMGHEDLASTSDRAYLSPAYERCPYNSASATTPHDESLGRLAKDISIIGFAAASIPGAITTWIYTSCASFANCKRGPPSPVLSLETTTDWPAA
jgi:hypothetical protein